MHAHEVRFQSQLVLKFSHAFFLSTHLWVFAKHLINLCQIHHFWQKFAFFEKSVIVTVAFFVISFEFCPNLSCYILPKFAILKIANYQHTLFCHLIWIFGQTLDDFFGTLAIFVEICLLSIFLSLSPHLRFCQTVDGFLPNSPFSEIRHSCVNRQLSMCLFCCLIVSILAKFSGFAKYAIFVKPTIIDMPLLSSCFNFCQTLNKFLPNLSFS